MNKKLPIFLITTVFFIGAIIGYKIASQRYEKEIQISLEEEDSGYVKNSVYLLNLLRTNNSAKTIDNLEMNLDWELFGLNYSMRNAPKSPLDRFFLKTIQEAKEYRRQFPHKSDSPSLDEAISNVFLRVNTLTNK